MGIVVNTNVNSFKVQRSLSAATSEVGKSLERLSTGSKINRAADDAAGLTISESLKAQERGAAVASTNAQSGVNLLQTAEGDMSVIQDNLQRIRDLAVQAANGTNGTSEREAIKAEVTQRTKEIDRISSSSAFNQIKLLNGSNTALTLQIGGNFDKTKISLNSLKIGDPFKNANSSALGITINSAFDSAAKAASYVSRIDAAIATISVRRSTIGSLQNRVESAIRTLAVKQENMSASGSLIRDTDIAKEAAAMSRNQILQQASTTLLAQANSAPQIALSLI